MIRSIRDFLNPRIDPAPNPLRITVSSVDDQLTGLRADPRWGHDPAIRLRADRLLDVRAVLARHEEQDRRDAACPGATRPATRQPHERAGRSRARFGRRPGGRTRRLGLIRALEPPGSARAAGPQPVGD